MVGQAHHHETVSDHVGPQMFKIPMKCNQSSIDSHAVPGISFTMQFVDSFDARDFNILDQSSST